MKIDTTNTSTIISVIISIIIFFLGFLINEVIRRYKKAQELKQYKQFIKEWAEKGNETLTVYIESLKKFANAIAINNMLDVPQRRDTIIHLVKLNSISLKEYSDVYIWGLKEKDNVENRRHLINFLYQLDYLSKAPNVINKLYDMYYSQNKKIMEEWNMYYKQLLDQFVSTNNQGLQPFESQIFSKVSDYFRSAVCKEKNQKSFLGIEYWEKEFIKPSLSDILSDKKSSTSVVILQIFNIINNLRVLVEKHYGLNGFGDAFNEYVAKLNEVKNTINESMSYFNNKKIKKFVK